MKKGWARPEHVGKITIAILDKLSAKFFEEVNKEDPDFKLLISLSQAAGYQAQLYGGLQKTHDYAKRIEKIEKFMEHADPELLAMGLNPVVIHDSDQRVKESAR